MFNYDDVRKNMSRIDNNYQVRYKFMLRNKADYEYKNPHKGPYEIIQC